MKVKSGLTLKQLKMPFVGLIRIICINKTVCYKRRKRAVEKEQCPPKGGRGGRSGRNGYERSGVTEVRGQGSGRGQWSRATDSDIGGSVDVVHVTPPKDRNQQNHDDDSVDRRFTKSSSETVRCALTFATGNSDVGNVVLVTPPQQNEKHRRVIEDDDEYFDPPLTDTTLVHGGGAPKTGTLSCAHNDETPTGESDHIVLVTPHKQYNKHNRVIEADDEFEGPRKKKKLNKCSRCFKGGHKKTTCKEPVP
ncbi:BnaC07g03850D [Brassica napus]|uniref:BnaC07g03850D protein n=1 Tax=Brassica napus TaxID=3708 RepID=A0A078I9D9_BRANA|nr:BnaC07g03850D [Brassica napus]